MNTTIDIHTFSSAFNCMQTVTGTVGKIGVPARYHAEKARKLPNEESGSLLKMEAGIVLVALNRQHIVRNHHVQVSKMSLFLCNNQTIYY